MREVKIKIGREEILYDVRNYAYVEADVMKAEGEHERHQVFDIGEDGNVDRVTRVLNLAFDHCVELCYPYSKKALEAVTLRDDELREPKAYVMELSVPDGFSETTVNLLAKLVHELLVYYVMADWMSLTKPGAEEKWQKKIAESEDEMHGIINARRGRVRRPLTPF